MWGYVGKIEVLSWCRCWCFCWVCYCLYVRIFFVFWVSKWGFFLYKLLNYRNEFCLLVNCFGKEFYFLLGISFGFVEFMDMELMIGWFGLLDVVGCWCVGVYFGERNWSKKGGVYCDGY